MLVALWCLPNRAQAQEQPVTPEAHPADVATIEAIVEAAMASFSGPADEGTGLGPVSLSI